MTMEKQNDRRSLLMLTASMVIYGTIGIFRRSIPLSSGLLACVRGLLGSAFLAAFVKLRGGVLCHGIPQKEVMRLILSGAMMLRYSLNQKDAADCIENAVDQALRDGCRTRDIAGPGDTELSCNEMTEAILQRI